MPDIAGAMAAIEQRLTDNWSTTPIFKANTTPGDGFPPNDGSNYTPWAYIEIVNTMSNPRAVGQPGNQFWLYVGLVHVHVFAPIDTGPDTARNYASQISEIFRNQTFYNATPGYQVRTISPRIDQGDAADEKGMWFRVTATIPFEYYHRG